MTKPKAIVTRRWPDKVEEALVQTFDVAFNRDDKPFSRNALKEAFATADAVLATVTDSIDVEALSAQPLKARFLGNFGVGHNHIDLEAARRRAITVTNTPDVLTDATADLAMTLMLMVARRAGEGERQLRAGRWSGWGPTHMMGHQVSGKTLGVIGFGRIGRAVARRAHHGFRMRVLYHDLQPVPEDEARAVGATACATVEDVLAQADIVSLHCPGGVETRHLIDAERLAGMRSGAFLINTARGDVVDEAALISALRAGRIAGAGFDVYEAEPAVSPELLAMENVVLLPHLGSATVETRIAMGMKVLENAKAFFAGKEPPNRLV
jgi:lactate dehydrogenase-like 2-hydroxyacid dehydrogenase